MPGFEGAQREDHHDRKTGTLTRRGSVEVRTAQVEAALQALQLAGALDHLCGAVRAITRGVCYSSRFLPRFFRRGAGRGRRFNHGQNLSAQAARRKPSLIRSVEFREIELTLAVIAVLQE